MILVELEGTSEHDDDDDSCEKDAARLFFNGWHFVRSSLLPILSTLKIDGIFYSLVLPALTRLTNRCSLYPLSVRTRGYLETHQLGCIYISNKSTWLFSPRCSRLSLPIFDQQFSLLLVLLLLLPSNSLLFFFYLLLFTDSINYFYPTAFLVHYLLPFLYLYPSISYSCIYLLKRTA